MQFLAGIIAGWSIVYLIIAASLLVTFVFASRNRDYVIFAGACVSMSIYSMARTAHYLAPGIEGTVVPGRILMAALPLGGMTLLHLAIRRTSLRDRVRRVLVPAMYVVAGTLSALCLAGFAVDYDVPSIKHFAFVAPDDALSEYRLTPIGHLVCVTSLCFAIAAGTLMFAGTRDRVIRTVVAVATLLLVALTVHDILQEANIVRSIYMVEHGFFVMVVGVLLVLLREYERSRMELEARNRDLAEASEHVERLSVDLSESAIRLDRVTDETRRLRPMADLGRLSASLAHEIRNPLAVLTNVASTLRRHGTEMRDRGEFSSLVEMLQEETDRLARLVDDLLLFSRTGRVSREPVHPSDIVKMARDEVEKIVPDHEGIRIEVDVEPDLDHVIGSLESLRRGLVNLVVNAIQSSTRPGTVRIVARSVPRVPGLVQIGVEDEAGGIPEDLVQEIFEPFFSTRPTGTGLGLPIVKSIVEAHDGDLALENRPGEGAGFWMTLPAERYRPSAH